VLFFVIFLPIPVACAIKYVLADRRYRGAIERVAGFRKMDAWYVGSGSASKDTIGIFRDLNRIAADVRAGKYGVEVTALLAARDRWFFLYVAALPTCAIGAGVALKLLGR
jgi:hypothetical protein